MPENFTEQSLQMAIEAANNLSLADSLLRKITRTKAELYPAIKESEQVNESAQQVNLILKRCYDLLDAAAVEVHARCK